MYESPHCLAIKGKLDEVQEVLDAIESWNCGVSESSGDRGIGSALGDDMGPPPGPRPLVVLEHDLGEAARMHQSGKSSTTFGHGRAIPFDPAT